jgi:hypothetical protein
MPKESKVFTTIGDYDTNDIVYHRESFGWELNSVANVRIAMHRETTIPNYFRLTEYERQYDENTKLYQHYRNKSSFSLMTAFILLLLFIVPMGLYIWYKVSMKQKASFHLSELERIVNEARMIRYSEGDNVVV